LIGIADKLANEKVLAGNEELIVKGANTKELRSLTRKANSADNNDAKADSIDKGTDEIDKPRNILTGKEEELIADLKDRGINELKGNSPELGAKARLNAGIELKDCRNGPEREKGKDDS
jgi:hypothetical protein